MRVVYTRIKLDNIVATYNICLVIFWMIEQEIIYFLLLSETKEDIIVGMHVSIHLYSNIFYQWEPFLFLCIYFVISKSGFILCYVYCLLVTGCFVGIRKGIGKSVPPFPPFHTNSDKINAEPRWTIGKFVYSFETCDSRWCKRNCSQEKWW